jgi:hypothetical protein
MHESLLNEDRVSRKTVKVDLVNCAMNRCTFLCIDLCNSSHLSWMGKESVQGLCALYLIIVMLSHIS